MRRHDGAASARGYRPEGMDDAFVTGDDRVPDAAAQAEPVPARSRGKAHEESGKPGSVPDAAPVLPALGWRGWLRWGWRQLTSMRVALLLLMLLAVAAVPGSVLPQRPVNPSDVLQYVRDNPVTGPWLDRFGFFDVYSSPWFSAIYLLLFISLVGCILPRTTAHLRALRSRPPRAPRRFERFPVHHRMVTDAPVDDVVAAAASHLRGTGWWPTFRVDVGQEGERAGGPDRRSAARTVAAERGYLRETGNLVFHLALVGLLIAVAAGQLFHYRGQVIVTEGRGFANAVVDYDTFDRGTLFRESSLKPFSMTLDKFESKFAMDEAAFAQSRDFTAKVTVRHAGSTTGRGATIKVNDPLSVDGAKIYLQGNGYAPQITVRDARGKVAFSGRVPFLPQDSMYTSRGVIKVPDVSGGLDQLGMVGYLLPTADVTSAGAKSVFPQPLNPLLVLEVYHGDLGLDGGVPQNVYQLDTAKMSRDVDAKGQPVRLLVQPGKTVQLPDGQGSVTFEALPRYVALDLRHDPSLPWVLAFALLAVAGLAVSLFAPRRRVWVRAWTGSETTGPRTVVEVAGLARGDDIGLPGEVESLVTALPPAAGGVESSSSTPPSGSAPGGGSGKQAARPHRRGRRTPPKARPTSPKAPTTRKVQR